MSVTPSSRKPRRPARRTPPEPSVEVPEIREAPAPVGRPFDGAEQDRIIYTALIGATFLIVKDWLGTPLTDPRQVLALALFAFSICAYGAELGIAILVSPEEAELKPEPAWLSSWVAMGGPVATVTAIALSLWYVAWLAAVVFTISAITLGAGVAMRVNDLDVSSDVAPSE
jgi:hypothetical protein